MNTTGPALDVFGGTINQEGAGSGWIINTSGLIVTNNHVVEGASSITVTLDDGRNSRPAWCAPIPVSDLAVVKINADNLKAAKVGDSSKLRVGDWVIASATLYGTGHQRQPRHCQCPGGFDFGECR